MTAQARRPPDFSTALNGASTGASKKDDTTRAFCTALQPRRRRPGRAVAFLRVEAYSTSSEERPGAAGLRQPLL